MIFDSLDLLSKIDGAHELLWFPPTLPANVKVGFITAMNRRQLVGKEEQKESVNNILL